MKLYGVFVPQSAGKHKQRKALAQLAKKAARANGLKLRGHTDPNRAADVRDQIATVTGRDDYEVDSYSHLSEVD